jgi:hypothetical protein
VGAASGEVIAFGVAVTLSPLAVIAVVLMLAVPGERASAAAFVAAWVLSLTAVGAVVLVLADAAEADAGDGPATWVSVLKLLIALLLLVTAARQWRSRGAGDGDGELPPWLTRVGDITAPRAAALAVGLASIKPKNLLLTIAAAISIAQVGAEPGAQAAALALFVVLGTIGPAAPLAVHAFMGERGDALLARLRVWLVREQPTIVAVLCVAVAAKLVGDAVVSLAG